MAVKVFNKRRGNSVPSDAVYIGRPTVWGNPFSKGSKEKNIADFREYAVKRHASDPSWLAPLRGKSVVCWCAPAGCHGDVIIQLANQEVEQTDGLRVAVTGGRDFSNKHVVWETLDYIHNERGISELVHGGARGADTIAGEWAKHRGVKVSVFLPEWDKLGKRAGIVRNQVMLDQSPDVVVAYPGGRGTGHMVSSAKRQGFKVIDAEQFQLDIWAEENCPEYPNDLMIAEALCGSY